jgi:hypothetical protein
MCALSLGRPAITIAFAGADQTQRSAASKLVERSVGDAETFLANFGDSGNGSSGVPS